LTEKQAERPAVEPADLEKIYRDIAEKSAQLAAQYLERQKKGALPGLTDELGIAQAFFEAWMRLLSDPFKLAEAQLQYWQDAAALWQTSLLKLMGQDVKPVAEPREGDRRFKHQDWQQHFLYDYIKQSYLIAARHLHRTVGHVQGLDEQTARKVDFYTRQYIDALSPSNFLLTNPEVLRETVASAKRSPAADTIC
jgi:polyhydroxyalkanoate synthase subunit PhaC